MLHGRLLRYLDEVTRCGSIRKAAERLHVASSAINRQILAYERDIDMPLFERMPRGLRLTSAGEVLIEHVRATLKAYERVEQRLEAMRGHQRGSVTLATTLGLAAGPLRDIVSTFLLQSPGVHVTVRALVAEAIPAAVIAGEADLALSYNLAIPPGLRSRLSLDVPIVAVVAPDHPLADRGAASLAELASYPLVLPAIGMTVRDLLDEAFERVSLVSRPVFETNSVEMIKLLVADTPRVTVLNPMDVAVEQQRGTLRAVPLRSPHLRPQTLQIISRSRIALDAAGSLFLEQLRSVLVELVREVLQRTEKDMAGLL